jgi:hypothetical protein
MVRRPDEPVAVSPFERSATRAVYVDRATAGSMLTLLPTLKAAGYNTPFVAAQWTEVLHALQANAMSAWVTLGQFSSGAFTIDEEGALELARSAWGILPGCTFYLADEPDAGDRAAARLILARAAAITAALPEARCMISYFDADTLPLYEGIDLVALDLYVSRHGWNWPLLTRLAAASDAAGIAYTGIAGVFSDGTVNYPMPTVEQTRQNIGTWKATNSEGFGVYAWGLGAEQPAYRDAIAQE